jgi:hypothetical protein
MKKLIFILLLNFNCLYAQENIILHDFRKINSDEMFIYTTAENILKGERHFRLTVFIKKENKLEKYLEFIGAISLYMFQDNKRFIVYMDTTNWSQADKNEIDDNYGDPLYYIDGDKGTIDYIGTTVGAFFILEEPLVYVSVFYRNDVSNDIYVYDIIEKEVICYLETRTYIESRVIIDRNDFFYVGFVDIRDNKVTINNNYIRIKFEQGDMGGGKKSFFAYLNLSDLRNLKIEESPSVGR